MITRHDYMAKKATHDEYYGQFVTPAVQQSVVRCIGLDRILRSEDPHLNDIPLKEWDQLQPVVMMYCGRKLAEANGTGGVSLSDTVCVAKCAARSAKREAQGAEQWTSPNP